MLLKYSTDLMQRHVCIQVRVILLASASSTTRGHKISREL